VLLDEASRFRNHSKRTVTLKTLGSHARTRYAFTGNLTVRNPADSWYVMNWLTPGLFGTTNRTAFIHTYCLLGGYMGNQPIGIRPDKLAQFRMILDANRIKCELRDVRDLPDRVMTVRRVTFSGRQHKAYEQMRLELRAEIMRMSADDFVTHASTYAVRLLRLQEIAAGFGRNTEGEVEYLPSPKTTEMVETILADPDPPTVIWTYWRPEQTLVCASLAKAGIAHVVLGQPNAVQDFMSGKVDTLVSQVSQGGYGLNLTRATRMIYHAIPWDLDTYLQSQERNMRLTTTATSLEIVHLLVRGSVDEYVRNRLLDKAGMSRQLSRSQALDMLT
jgi:SNF2 family DNA or RNA helicase